MSLGYSLRSTNWALNNNDRRFACSARSLPWTLQTSPRNETGRNPRLVAEEVYSYRRHFLRVRASNRAGQRLPHLRTAQVLGCPIQKHNERVANCNRDKMLRCFRPVFGGSSGILSWLRYRVDVAGLEKLRGLRGPTLVLPNHPAYIYPPLLSSRLKLQGADPAGRVL